MRNAKTRLGVAIFAMAVGVTAEAQENRRDRLPSGPLNRARDQLQQKIDQGIQQVEQVTRAATGAAPSDYLSTPINATVPANTILMVRTQERISSQNAPGSTFSATLETDIMGDGVLVAPKGSQVFGKVSEQSRKGRNMVGQAMLDLELTGMTVKNGLHPIATSNFQQTGEREGLKTARNVGVGAVIGQASERKGEKPNREASHIGAAAGLGAGALSKGDQVEIPAGSVLQFQLTMPLVINEQPAAAPSTE